MKRSKFSLSNYKLLTCNMGELIPIGWYEALPGDTIQQSTSSLIRVSPLLAPLMHPVRVRIHHWFVPNRLIWDDFEEFITGGPDGTSVPVHPYRASGTFAEGHLFDYLGVPPATYSAFEINALPIRAYNLIFNEFYRDQDLVTAATISTASGADATTGSSVHKVAWEKDYFTTCRPWEQKGNLITIPLVGDAPVTGLGSPNTSWTTGPINSYETDASGSRSYANYKNTGFLFEEDPSNAGYPNIRADLSAVSGVDLNDLRLALALQRYQEARAQFGSRYVEYLRYLGVKGSDRRATEPIYLGGGRQVIQFSEVLSTDGANTGKLKGHGIAAMRTNRYRRFFDEHGIVMTLMSVVPKTVYASGMKRAWFREVKEDYFQKELQFIGQQEVYNKEVRSNHATPDGVFGYQNRYDEYRYNPSEVAGEFRSTSNFWHLARTFSSDPALNSTFIQAVPTTRVYAAPSSNQLQIMANNSVQARRMLVKYAKPKTF